MILAITAIICSRMLFSFFNDPEGPNLLIVIVTAAIIYFVSLATYLINPSVKNLSSSSSAGLKRLFLVILTQIVLVICLYVCLN